MSQIDKVIFFPLLFWFFLLSIFFYFTIYSIFLAYTLRVLKIRSIFYNDLTGLVSSIYLLIEVFDYVYMSLLRHSSKYIYSFCKIYNTYFIKFALGFRKIGKIGRLSRLRLLRGARMKRLANRTITLNAWS